MFSINCKCIENILTYAIGNVYKLERSKIAFVTKKHKVFFNKRVDHTNLIIRPQDFGRLRPVSS